MLKTLICSLVSCLIALSATAEWSSHKTSGDPFEPVSVFAETQAVEATYTGRGTSAFGARCKLQFRAKEAVSKVSLRIDCSVNVEDISKTILSGCFRNVIAKSRVDTKLTPVKVRPGFANSLNSDSFYVEVHIDSATRWYDSLSNAEELLFRIQSEVGCGNFDMEFDVSGRPNLTPAFP